MKNNFFKIFIGAVILTFSSIANANAPEKPPKKWPCDQVYNPKLNLTAIWQGPPIEQELKDWWKDDDVIEYVNKLADPVLEESVGEELIEEFAKKYSYFGLIKKPERKQKLTYLFAGLYQKAKDRRNRQYVGIIKFVERQDSIRKAIGSSSKLIRKYRKAKLDEKDPKFVEASAQLKWNTRVFDQRTRLTEYICEEPVFNTQRLGYQARKILSYLQ
mgnify:FL=1|tara:strand:+ start:241 stop:888 length:648 start_codon:yes stop_codon:yes gene_type:complete